MRKTALYYFVINPYNKNNSYVMVQYSNGDIRYWHEDDKGYKSARSKAMSKK
jgi:hypothetical protein